MPNGEQRPFPEQSTARIEASNSEHREKRVPIPLLITSPSPHEAFCWVSLALFRVDRVLPSPTSWICKPDCRGSWGTAKEGTRGGRDGRNAAQWRSESHISESR